MKRKLLALLVVVTALTCLPTNNSNAAVAFSISVFNGPLGQCGHWIDRPGYGRCWYPAYVSSSWRPYCEGYWMWTDQGWYWVSNEPWAWATYHYGRWVEDPYYGWVWVPDTEWGPCWVSWRQSDEYVGWAPLPPGASFGPEGYVVVHDPPPRAFVFVEVGRFSEPVHRQAVIVNNVTIVNKTVNITKITRVNNVVVNNGPKVQDVQKTNSRSFTEPPPPATTDHIRSNQPRQNVERSANPPPQSYEPHQSPKAEKYSEKPDGEPQPQQSQPHGVQPPSQKQQQHEEREDRKDQRQEEKDSKKNQQPNGN